jgi:glycosyltransferase involved in cell wall biosynthesis
MLRPPPVLSIVVPCFNEEAALPWTSARLLAVLEELIASASISASSGIYFVDDGSSDRTWPMITELTDSNPRVRGIKLSRNHGHQSALLAGLLTVPGDAIISIDADLQDDVSAMKEMVAAYTAGADIVYGVRRGRRTDTWFKRVTAEGYYRLAEAMGVRLVFNHADYRLLSRRALEALQGFQERNLFLRGIIPQLGFNSAEVYYDRHERVAGESKYPVRKMLAFAFDGITSFSAVPLKLITMLGLGVAATSFVTALWALWVRTFNPAAVPGWTSTVVPLYFLGGIQLLCTGIIGQYLAKVYIETKARPRFTIERVLEARSRDLSRTATSG